MEYTSNILEIGSLIKLEEGLTVDKVTNNVGIGTDNPSQKLEIAEAAQQGTTPPTIRITNTTTTYGSTATIGVSHGTIEFYQQETSGNYPAVSAAIMSINEDSFAVGHGLGFFTNNNALTPSEQMRITSAGNVGIGTSSPVSKLNVDGSITATGGARTNPTGGGSIVVDYQTTSDLQGRVRSRDWDGGIWKNITLEGANIIAAPSGTEVGRFTSNGLTFNGDTAAANALDDYEEGTFTPTIIGSITAGTATYGGGQVGTYTKIGNVVYFQIYLGYSGGTGTGDLRIAGLPFTIPSNDLPSFTFGVFLNVALTALNIPIAGGIGSTNQIYINQIPTGGGLQTSVPYDASAVIQVSGFYRV